jgi:hypothetical protein
MLTDAEVLLLDTERAWWKHPAAKETHIREQLGISMTRCYQLLRDQRRQRRVRPRLGNAM